MTPSGEGQVLFKVEDIYTNTLADDGTLITGLEGATIYLQNEQLAAVNASFVSAAGGEVLSDPLPAGSYRFRATAPDHTEATGRLEVRAGIVSSERLFLDSELVTVEWSVVETSIQDQYDIVLEATYAVNVPTAVIALEPSVVNLPFMRAGDVFYGELVLSNYGLIGAYEVRLELPENDPYLRYELLQDSVPTVLEAKQQVVIPYRLTALRDFVAEDSGGGCFTYAKPLKAGGSSRCANGDTVSRESSTLVYHRSGSTCGGEPILIGGSTGGHDLVPGGSGGPDGTLLDEPSGLPPCRPSCSCQCTKGGQSGFGSGGGSGGGGGFGGGGVPPLIRN